MKWVENLWWNQNIPPLLWRRAIIQHSVSWRWIGREVSVHKFQVIFACVQNHPDLPKTEWAVLWLSSFSIFPTRLHEVQLLMSRLQQQFLRSQHDRWIRFPYEKQNWPPTAKYQNGQVLFSSSFWLCTICLLSRLVSPSYLFLHKSKPWGDMKETDIKKRKFNSDMKKTGRYTIHPQSISIIPATVQFGVLLQSRDKYWQLGGVHFFPSGG